VKAVRFDPQRQDPGLIRGDYQRALALSLSLFAKTTAVYQWNWRDKVSDVIIREVTEFAVCLRRLMVSLDIEVDSTKASWCPFSSVHKYDCPYTSAKAGDDIDFGNNMYQLLNKIVHADKVILNWVDRKDMFDLSTGPCSPAVLLLRPSPLQSKRGRIEYVFISMPGIVYNFLLEVVPEVRKKAMFAVFDADDLQWSQNDEKWVFKGGAVE
jgi:hypothetical protein